MRAYCGGRRSQQRHGQQHEMPGRIVVVRRPRRPRLLTGRYQALLRRPPARRPYYSPEADEPRARRCSGIQPTGSSTWEPSGMVWHQVSQQDEHEAHFTRRPPCDDAALGTPACYGPSVSDCRAWLMARGSIPTRQSFAPLHGPQQYPLEVFSCVAWDGELRRMVQSG